MLTVRNRPTISHALRTADYCNRKVQPSPTVESVKKQEEEQKFRALWNIPKS